MMQHYAYNATIATTANVAATIANVATTITNAYIAMMLISSKVLIIRCDDVYNAAPANMRSRDAVNVYNFAAISVTATATVINVTMFIMLLVLI